MQQADPTNGGNAFGLVPFPEKGKPREPRLADYNALNSIYCQMLTDDQISSKQRYGIQMQINGAPPYAEGTKRKAGTAGASNLNFGEARARIAQTQTIYNDMLDSLKAFIEPMIPIDLYDDTTRQNAEDTIAEEWTTMLRDRTDFDARWQLLSNQFVTHGVSLAYFPDDNNWMFDATGWDNFLIPRGTRNSEEFIEILILTKDETPSGLYKNIRNEKAATETGWNVDAVKKALIRATKFASSKYPTDWGLDWNNLARQIKGNDLQTSYSNTARVYLMHGLVKEFDGSISHYIAERNGGSGTPNGPTDFLYKRPFRFPPDSSVFTIFCLNVGNGYYHSIRGQGYDQYAHCQTLNKMQNDLVNNFRLAMATMLQKTDGNSLDEAPIIVANGLAIMSPQVEMVERDVQDHTRMAMPVVNFFTRKLDDVSPVVSGNTDSSNDSVMTKYQLQAKQNTGSVLNTGSVNMFNRSWKRLLREMWRRTQKIIREKRTDEFPDVGAFVRRCERREISVEMIMAVERINEVRSIGAGSPQQQQLVMDKMMGLMPTFDERGRQCFLHDNVTLLVGNRRAQRYMPLTPKQRPTQDQTDAQMENGIMFNGSWIEPLDGQNHAIHATVHLGGEGSRGPDIASSIQILEDWRNQGERGDITELEPHIKFLSFIIPHTEQHVAAMSLDPTRAELAASYRKALQEYAATWMTYVRQINKALDEQAHEEEQQQQPDPVKLAKIAQIKQDMDLDIRRFQTDEMIKVADVQQKMKLRQREADAKLAGQVNKANAEMASKLAPASQSDFVTNRTAHTPNV